MNQITKIEDLIGKTITNIEQCYDELWFKFSDNSYAIMFINDITEGFGYEKNEINLYKDNKSKTEYMLVEFGIITKQEHIEACEQEELEYQKRQEERDNQEKERIEKHELDELNRLSQKYGKLGERNICYTCQTTKGNNDKGNNYCNLCNHYF